MYGTMSNANASIESTMQIVPRIFPSPAACKRLYQGILLLSDATMLILAFALAYWLRFHIPVDLFNDGDANLSGYIGLAWILIPMWLGLFALLQLYNFDNLLGGTNEYTRAVNGCTSGMMLVIIASFLIPSLVIARAWLVMAWLLSCLFICVARLFLRRVAYALRRQGYFVSPMLVVGANSEAESLADQLKDSVYSGVSIVGLVDSCYGEGARRPSLVNRFHVLGSLDSLPELIHRYRIEEVVVASTALTREQRLQTALLLSEMPGVRMSLSSGLFEIFTTGMRVNTRNAVPLLSLNRMRLDPLEVGLKTLLDYLLIALAAPTLILLFVLIGLLVKLDSPGPVFHRRRVLGIGGQEFDAFKFRSMVVNGDEILARYPAKLAEWQKTQKIKDGDPRITRIGHFLRKTSLDELPQVLNILLGQMSLVGPRMIHPDEAANYGPYRSNLLTVKPGLTGLWQVSGRSDTSYEERVQMDMHYIRNYSIWLDIQILFFQTLPAVFSKKGAY
jgi:exopolysaccharide biosynthesis polyprenyl glycosylphosphotransferase